MKNATIILTIKTISSAFDFQEKVKQNNYYCRKIR